MNLYHKLKNLQLIIAGFLVYKPKCIDQVNNTEVDFDF